MINELNEMSNDHRLEVYEKLISGVQHVYSKGQLQEDRLNSILDILMPLRTEDPIFLAHLTSYIIKKSDNKDLKVIVTLVNALSDADGSLFNPTVSKLRKPNFRLVSHAAIQELDPKMVRRIFELAGMKVSKRGKLTPRKFSLDDRTAVHIPKSLRKAVLKYLRFREQTPNGVNGIVKSGLKNTFIDLFRLAHAKPMPSTAIKLRWTQKSGDVTKNDFKKSMFDFSGLDDVQIAEKIVKEEMSTRSALGAIDKISPVIAVALLQVATGDEVVILTKMLEDSGILRDKEVQKVYKSKIKDSKNAIDRIKTFETRVSKEILGALNEGKSEAKKKIFEEKVGGLTKTFFHVDVSVSMKAAISWIKENAASIMEMIPNPEHNFGWGGFSNYAVNFPMPQEFSGVGIEQALYGIRPTGTATNCFALYEAARKFGAEVDVMITDQEHNSGHYKNKDGRTFNRPVEMIREFHNDHPEIMKPKSCVIIDATMSDMGAISTRTPKNAMIISGHAFSAPHETIVKDAYEQNGIPVTILPTQITMNSALLTEQIAIATKGKMAILDDIMNIPLLKPPHWYYAV